MSNLFYIPDKYGKYWRYVLIGAVGVGSIGNLMYSVRFLNQQSESAVRSFSTLLNVGVSLAVTALCVLIIKTYLNPVFWGLLIQNIQEKVKELRTLNGIAGIVGSVIATVMIVALAVGTPFIAFHLYKFDLTTTHFGSGLGASFPLLSTAAVPTFLMVFGPDIAALIHNMSSVTETKTRSLGRGNGKGSKPTQQSSRPAVPSSGGGHPLSGKIPGL